MRNQIKTLSLGEEYDFFKMNKYERKAQAIYNKKNEKIIKMSLYIFYIFSSIYIFFLFNLLEMNYLILTFGLLIVGEIILIILSFHLGTLYERKIKDEDYISAKKVMEEYRKDCYDFQIKKNLKKCLDESKGYSDILKEMKIKLEKKEVEENA